MKTGHACSQYRNVRSKMALKEKKKRMKGRKRTCIYDGDDEEDKCYS